MKRIRSNYPHSYPRRAQVRVVPATVNGGVNLMRVAEVLAWAGLTARHDAIVTSS